ncbi:BnaA06g01380D [Brassica napus]|uniref:BnaA06g01380D protein n=1 Tax=Brassica napus TaxID=3708 RepID=A0A078IN92_BRANA|nr:BnaA06g01380D [Brassica napus]
MSSVAINHRFSDCGGRVDNSDKEQREEEERGL